ncbi:DUF2812 domain-containing protein [Rummeliibacillus pycnus]|uniref:DUF2812 domain-containing protein n=1 Tax=Rummeliibacillus pycnus TaxID=101070 RepID=UPI0037CADFE3
MKRYFRNFIDYEKEEQWINAHSLNGLHLKRFSPLYYQFEEGKPGEYIYRVVLLPKDREEYLDFLASTGIEIVCKYYKWAYVRKKSEEGPFELYSDHTSKITYYKQIILFYMFIFIINFLSVIMNFGIFFFIKGESVNNLNGLVGLLNALVVILLLFPLLKTYNKKNTLQKEHGVFL